MFIFICRDRIYFKEGIDLEFLDKSSMNKKKFKNNRKDDLDWLENLDITDSF